MEDRLPVVHSDPEIMGGTVVFVGTRVPLSNLIEYLEGDYTLKVPEGTQTGTTFRIKNKGMPVVHSHSKGDLFVEVKVHTPQKLTKRQRELLQEFEGGAGVNNQPERRTLMGKVKDIFG